MLLRPGERFQVEVAPRRELECRVFGAEDYTGVDVYNHGLASSSIEGQLAHRIAQKARRLLLAFSRPGIGRSTFHAKHTTQSWALDIETATKKLGVDVFGLIGMSAGGQFTLGGARWITRERVRHVTVIAAPAPLSHPLMQEKLDGPDKRFIKILTARPSVAKLVLWYKLMRERFLPGSYLREISKKSPPSDMAILGRPGVRATLLEGTAEAGVQGVRGLHLNLHALVTDHGHHLSEIEHDVELLHGDADPTTPIGMAEHNAALLQKATITRFAGGGHFMAADEDGECALRLVEKLSALDRKVA